MEIISQDKSHLVQIYAEEKLETNGVKEIKSSTEKEVIAKLETSYMSISGEGLTIIKLIPETGELLIKGKITAVKFSSGGKKNSILKRVFK